MSFKIDLTSVVSMGFDYISGVCWKPSPLCRWRTPNLTGKLVGSVGKRTGRLHSDTSS